MTAYITASLLEMGVPSTVNFSSCMSSLQMTFLFWLYSDTCFDFQDPVITNALSCLRPVVGNVGNTYTTALLAYTFSLAEETTTRSQLLTTLNNLAISEGEIYQPLV
jgi:hypothetical protein